MRKFLKIFSVFIFLLAKISANTPSQLGVYQIETPDELKK